MNNKLKLSMAFIVGGIAFNATSVMSNFSATEDVLAQAIAGAILKVSQYEQHREDAELAKLPNILDCQNMQWMENCTEVNKQAKKNPTAPVRIQNQEGLEFNFVPGTPSAVIRLQLEQTPEAATAAVRYMDSTWGEYKRSADLYKQAMWREGPLDNIIGLDRAMEASNAPKAINTEALSLSVFVHSQCGACEVQLSTIGQLQSRYPKLKITVYQFDNNEEGFRTKVTNNGLKGRILRPDEIEKVMASGVDKWPTTWIDNLQLRTRERLPSVRSIVQLEEKMLGMTHVISAAK